MPPGSTAKFSAETMSASEDLTNRAGRTMYWLAALAMLGLFWLFFDKALERRDDPNRYVISGFGEELILKRDRMGHYVAPGTINGHPVRFMLDTGATTVAIPARLGNTLGLSRGGSHPVSTANGTVTVYATRIGKLGLGPFVFADIEGNLNPGMDGDEILLGMSLLRHLEFTQQGDTLILKKGS